MPRYFFDCLDQPHSFDEEGVDFPDLISAKIEAVRLIGEILRDNPNAISADKDYQIVVRSHTGLPLVRVRTSVGPSIDIPTSYLRPAKSSEADMAVLEAEGG